MKMDRLNIQLPRALKAKLDEMRKEGTTSSGFIRSLLERALAGKESKSHGRQTS